MASLFLLGILSTLIVLPIAWLVGALRRKDPLAETVNQSDRRLKWVSGGLGILFGVLAVIFVTAITFFTVQAMMNGTLSIFSVSAASAPFFVIPLLLGIIAIALLLISVNSWRRKMWSIWMRIYYSFIAFCALGYVTVLALGGMMTVLL